MSINNDNINIVGKFDAQCVEINFKKILMFIGMQKNKLQFNFFFEIL